MSLTDSVVKNTYYHVFSQFLGLLSPLILTPIIISHIGVTEYGIYILIAGFIGTFGLLDISLSASFVRFISIHYNNAEHDNVNSVINTGFVFYLIFSLTLGVCALLLKDLLFSIINIPGDKLQLATTSFYYSVVIFFFASTFSVFNAILVAVQKMYLGAIAGMYVMLANFLAILILMFSGYGLVSLLVVQLISTIVSAVITITLSFRVFPALKINPAYFNLKRLRSMSVFGIQMQVSRLATFASEKYDEFLLGAFTTLSNVTLYNLGNKAAQYGKFLPSQLIAPIPAAAAELSAKKQADRLSTLFSESTKYLNTAAIPIFVFLFVFAESVFEAWMGEGFQLSASILRILVIGYAANFIFSVPGNIIIPNTGKPKYQMREGLIYLGINLVLSYFLIKYYGITGGAIGNALSVVISSAYIFFTSSKEFSQKKLSILKAGILKPALTSISTAILLFLLYYFVSISFNVHTRVNAILSVLILGISYITIYSALLLNFDFFNQKDFKFFMKFLIKLPVIKGIYQREFRMLNSLKKSNFAYNGELVSICIISFNRLGLLKKNLTSLIPTLKGINYELLIWDNNSSDGSAEYISSLQNSAKINLISSKENIGTNARGELFKRAKGEFIIGIDDDVWDYPKDWIREFISVYKAIPNAGFISLDVVKDEYTGGAKFPDDCYIEEKFSDSEIIFQSGPAGGWCFMISREIYNKIGEFYQPEGRIFFGDDGDYSARVLYKGYRIGIIKNLKVYHASGTYFNKDYKSTFDNKMKDLEKPIPFSYYFVRKLKKILSFNRYKFKLQEQIQRLIMENEN